MCFIDCSQEFDPIKYILENIPDEGGDTTFFDKQVSGDLMLFVHLTLICTMIMSGVCMLVQF
jgi:hypothetical protein